MAVKTERETSFTVLIVQLNFDDSATKSKLEKEYSVEGLTKFFF